MKHFILKSKNKGSLGFTLVETLISISIFALIVGIGYAMMNRSFMSMNRQRQSLGTLQEARTFLMYIERDIREMKEVLELDTTFTGNLFDEKFARFNKMTMLIPNREGTGYKKVTYTYEGPANYDPVPGKPKLIYREEEGMPKKAIITKQLDYLKVWGTDGTIFRTRDLKESESNYVAYLTKHYYNPSGVSSAVLRKLEDVKGIEVQLSMHEMLDNSGKPIKQRKFTTRIYPRILNSKYE